MSRTLADRFWEKVRHVEGDGCWEWTGARQSDGYAVIGYGRPSVEDRHRTARGHRVAWELAYGSIPVGLCVLHRCDNPGCVRPDHLFLGTLADNTSDMDRKGRGRRPHGESHPRAKLTLGEVNVIRSLYDAGGVTQAELGRIFGVSGVTIYKIVTRKIWKIA